MTVRPYTQEDFTVGCVLSMFFGVLIGMLISGIARKFTIRRVKEN